KNDFVVVRFQGCASIRPSDLEDIAQQLRHRGNATWVYHARYGVSIIQALVRNIMEAEGQQANPGPETTELIREICRRFVKDPRLMSQLTADHREVIAKDVTNLVVLSGIGRPEECPASKYDGLSPVVIIIGLIFFCLPGFFNALAGLGGAGNANPSAADPASIALGVSAATFSYFGGFFFNLLGPRLLMGAGGLTYAFYAAAAYISGHIANTGWLFILAGAILGFGAGWLWTAQGALILAYAPQDRKGHYIAVFWVIFNL
ncbi:DUF895 domain membrane protein, partial [Perkinsus olseni]